MLAFLKTIFAKPRPITYYELNEHIARTLEAIDDKEEINAVAEKLR